MVKFVPIARGDGVSQPVMNDIVDEGKKLRLKWGVGQLVADTNVTPIVVTSYHHGNSMCCMSLLKQIRFELIF